MLSKNYRYNVIEASRAEGWLERTFCRNGMLTFSKVKVFRACLNGKCRFWEHSEVDLTVRINHSRKLHTVY